MPRTNATSPGQKLTSNPGDDFTDDPDDKGGDLSAVGRGVECPSCSWSLRYIPNGLCDGRALLRDHEDRAHRTYTDMAWSALKRAIMNAGAVDCMDDPDLWFSTKREDQAAAITACETCPIAFECLDYALSVDSLHGIWGTTTPAERKALREIGTQPQAG